MPKLGARDVKTLTPREIADALLNNLSAVVSARARRVIRDACKLAMSDGQLTINRAGDALDPQLASACHVTKHHAALCWKDAPQMLAKLDTSDAAGLCVKLQVLTAVRPAEAREAQWCEIDGDVWTISADRTKLRREHRVPLTPHAVELLEHARQFGGDTYVFPAQRGDGAVSKDMATRRLKTIAPDSTLHGLRSTFRDWCRDNGKDFETAEAALAHSVGNAVERSYARSDLLDQRRTLMQQWTDYLHQQ